MVLFLYEIFLEFFLFRVKFTRNLTTIKMGLFGQMGDMYKLQKEAKKIKAELAKIHIFAESDGIKVTVSGDQTVLKVEILDETILSDPKKVEKAFMDATNRATKKSQQISAEKMKSLMGGMPGMS